MKRAEIWEPISEDVLKHVARIMGESSAAALALDDAQRRRARGQAVEFYNVKRGRHSYTVVYGEQP